MIEAAGGVVWRHCPSGGVEVLLVHRPHRADWSLPKGKLLPRESHADGALREVEEETGLRCELGRELPETRYRDRKRRNKRVRYWAMTQVSGSFAPNAEVDQVMWVKLEHVHTVLTYDHDIRVVDGLSLALA
jgi:8-oxo-dGTP diphosphatase